MRFYFLTSSTKVILGKFYRIDRSSKVVLWGDLEALLFQVDYSVLTRITSLSMRSDLI